MSELWLNHETLIRLTNWSDRTIREKRQHNEVVFRERPGRERNGRRAFEYAASSLPPEGQRKMYRLQLAASTAADTTQALTTPAAQSALFLPSDAEAGNARIALSPEQRKIAEQRLAPVKTMMEVKRRLHARSPMTITLGDGRMIDTERAWADYLGEQHDVSGRTIFRWVRRFRHFGLAGLADGIRADKNKSRWFQEHPEQAVFAQRKYFHERLSCQLTYEAMKREFGDALRRKCKDSDRVCDLNYDTVRQFLNAQPKPLAIMAREGEAEYHERCAPYIVRGYIDLRVNQCWCSDHMTHDVWVQNAGYFPGIGHDDAVRPWLSCWMDLRSRKIVGAVWYHTPSSYTAGSALRLALVENGVPETGYLDNGADYKKLGRENSLEPETEGVLARLGIQITNAIPYNAQAKPVESWFGNRLHERFDKLWKGFYCGSSPTTRPEDCSENLARHKAWREGKAPTSPLPPASEFVVLARDFIREYNNDLPHRGLGMEGRTPQAVFDALLPADQRKPVADTAALDALLWDRQKRRVSEGGCVQIYNARYEPADNDSRVRLFMEIEHDILVACDPTNLGEALALDQDGRLIGRLVAQKLMAQGPVSHEDIKVRMKLQRKLRRATKDTIAILGYGIESELDVRRRRAGIGPAAAAVAMPRQLPAAVGGSLAVREPVEFIDDLGERFAGRD
ncbi:MAG: hypothetical protein LAN70_02160 [Acidobacteriia bacterium]|nr:hypothetical protein [Terriglobia bacterium]